MSQTKQTQLKVRPRRTEITQVVWHDPPPKKRWGESLLTNLSVASAVVLAAVALRTGAIPQLSEATDAVMTAVTTDSILDDDLGRLSFVGAFFPEATLVFGETRDSLTLPVSGGTVVHAWSAAEPYMTWRVSSREVRASSDGEVIGVYHGNGEERLVQVLGSNGVSCLYGNLGEVAVTTGDDVKVGEILGTLMSGADCVMEVRRDGVSVDPALMFGQ